MIRKLLTHAGLKLKNFRRLYLCTHGMWVLPRLNQRKIALKSALRKVVYEYVKFNKILFWFVSAIISNSPLWFTEILSPYGLTTHNKGDVIPETTDITAHKSSLPKWRTSYLQKSLVTSHLLNHWKYAFDGKTLVSLCSINFLVFRGSQLIDKWI